MTLKKQLIEWADQYEVPGFILEDPIQFPHRFKDKRDVEISALLTSYLAFGKRAQIRKKASELHIVMGSSPYEYVCKGDFSALPIGNKKFYRFISYTDMNHFLSTLRSYYLQFDDLETALLAENCNHPMEALQNLFGHINYFPSTGSDSACKRICMFLRWVVRQNSSVDLGIWKRVDASHLLVPLDTHVHKMSIKLGITDRKNADMVTALSINNYFKEVFPGDPSRGDFSLFGFAMSNPDYMQL